MFHVFAVVFQLHLSVSMSLWAWTSFTDWRRLLTIPLQVALLLVASRQQARLGLAIALAVYLYEWTLHPLVLLPASIANHNGIELMCLVVLLIVNHRVESERELGLRVLRFLVVLVFVASGLQKLWHGSYFQGQFLAWSISSGGRWDEFLGMAVSEAERTRFQQFGKMQLRFDKGLMTSVAPGPYVLESASGLLVSNLVWILELVLPIGLLWKRSRHACLLGLVALLFAIEFVALELMFGSLMVNLLLLYSKRDITRWVIPSFATFYALVLGARLL